MVFTIGRGRPPLGNTKVGNVSWNEKHLCFVGSNGFYWHGRKFGGWQTEPPEASPEKRKRPASSGKGRRPNGNERVGANVTYNGNFNCYQTEKKYFWHGTFQGKWKRNPPGTDPTPEEEKEMYPFIVCDNSKVNRCDGADGADGSSKKQKRGNAKGRPPMQKIYGETVQYDTDILCWTTDRDGGLFWHGTYNGGWKNYPPKKWRHQI